MSKASPEAISLGGELILGGILESLSIKDNNIISRIPNGIISPSSLRCVVKKSHEAKFMRSAGFVCNHPCIISCDYVELDENGRLVKEIDFWDGELVK